MTGKRGTGFGRKLGLLVTSVCAVLLLAEGAVRLYAAFFFPKLMRVDAALGWRHNPNSAKSFVNEDGETHLVLQNEFGHRGRSHGLRRQAGKYRVLVLGDSFTEAVHVGEDELFTRLLEDADPGLEMLNAGVGGWGTVQEYLYLRDEGLRFAPDLVLVMYYENDLTDNCIPYSPGIGARPYAVLDRGSPDRVRIVEDYDDQRFLAFVAPFPFRSFLSRHSYLFYALNERVWQRLAKERLHRLQDADRRALDRAMTERVFVAVAGRMKAVADGRGMALALALIPDKRTVAAGQSPWHERVEALLGRRGIPVLSLLPALAQAQRGGERPYFDRDMHWTKRGHVVAARALLPFLRRLRRRKR